MREVNQNGRRLSTGNRPPWAGAFSQAGRQVRGVPARIGPKKPIRLFIAEWREAKGLSQEALGGRLGVSDVTVSRWETGKRRPDLDAQAAIAEALGVDVIDLFRLPSKPSADALLRDQPPEIQEQAIRVITAMRR